MGSTTESGKQTETMYCYVDIICGAVDDGLNDDLYIVPGIGDGGDRLFGTK